MNGEAMYTSLNNSCKNKLMRKTNTSKTDGGGVVKTPHIIQSFWYPISLKKFTIFHGVEQLGEIHRRIICSLKGRA